MLDDDDAKADHRPIERQPTPTGASCPRPDRQSILTVCTGMPMEVRMVQVLATMSPRVYPALPLPVTSSIVTGLWTAWLGDVEVRNSWHRRS